MSRRQPGEVTSCVCGCHQPAGPSPSPAPVVDNIAPVVEVIPADRRGGRMVRVQCPWCSRTHLHGWPAGQPAPGWRVPHCGRGGDYFIPAPVVRAARRRAGGAR